MTRKIPNSLENPLDNLLIELCEPTTKFFRLLGFNPNDITTLSFLFGLLAILFLYRNKPILSVVCYFISYFFDCADGYHARRYKMCTKFGDMYDHVKDITINITFITLLVSRNKHKLTSIQWILVALFFSFLIVGQILYFASQERYYNKLHKIPSLRWLGFLVKTKEDAIKTLKWSRYFGCGTFILSVCIFTLWIEIRK